MQPIQFIAYYYYSTAYYILLVFLCWFTTLYYIGSNGQKILHAEGSLSQGMAVVLTVLMIFFVGLRELARDFGDTIGYSRAYDHISRITQYEAIDFKVEWLWENLQIFCKNVLGMNVHDFFVFVAFFYFGGMLLASFILTRKNLWIAMMLFFSAFNTWSYGVNGIRNGLACSIVLVSIALLATDESKNNIRKIFCIVLMVLAMSIHRSTMLPSVAALTSLYVVKDTKWALRFWFASIIISLVAGPMIESFFASLGFDDRMSRYSEGKYNEYYQSAVSHTGFRWDFLLYGAFPVLLTWYVTVYRKFKDPVFSVLANTYLFCSAFWIMVIRASFSNRFAYLSWFIYPLLFTYPLLRMNLWKDQDRKTALILFAYSGFTFFMFFIYYFGTTGFKGFDQYWWR